MNNPENPTPQPEEAANGGCCQSDSLPEPTVGEPATPAADSCCASTESAPAADVAAASEAAPTCAAPVAETTAAPVEPAAAAAPAVPTVPVAATEQVAPTAAPVPPAAPAAEQENVVYAAPPAPAAPAAPVPAQSEKHNVFAVVALITGILTAFVGTIFGFIALAQIKKTGEKGRGLAIAGIVIGIFNTLATAAFIIFSVVLFAWAVDMSESDRPGAGNDYSMYDDAQEGTAGESLFDDAYCNALNTYFNTEYSGTDTDWLLRNLDTITQSLPETAETELLNKIFADVKANPANPLNDDLVDTADEILEDHFYQCAP